MEAILQRRYLLVEKPVLRPRVVIKQDGQISFGRGKKDLNNVQDVLKVF
jgi:hypothetical protein